METAGIKIKIPTEKIFKEVEIVDLLNNYSNRVTNPAGGIFTVWYFENMNGKEVLPIMRTKCKEKGIPFLVYRNSDDFIIDNYEIGQGEILCEMSLSKLKKDFQEWSGFKMGATNLEEARQEILSMKDTLCNEISDYAFKLEARAKKIFLDNLE